MIAVAQPLGCHMGVNLRGAEAAVSEQLLNAADVGAGVEQVGGEAVAKRVRAGAGRASLAGEIFLQQPADTAGRQPGAVLVEEQGGAS